MIQGFSADTSNGNNKCRILKNLTPLNLPERLQIRVLINISAELPFGGVGGGQDEEVTKYDIMLSSLFNRAL